MMQIFVRMLDQKLITCDVTPNTLIKELYLKLPDYMQEHIFNITKVNNGERNAKFCKNYYELDNNKTLSECGILGEMTIELRVRYYKSL